MKILIVKLSSLGDVVHAMPAVQDLRQAFPEASVDWVVERGFATLVQRCEGVRRAIPFDLRAWRRAPLAPETRRAWREFKAALQAEAYDWVIDLQGLTKSAAVAWLARLAPGGRRVAMANQTAGSGYEAPSRWVADVAIALPTRIDAVQRSRELCARALAYAVPNGLRYGLRGRDDRVGGRPAMPQVALVHGSSRADKLWPKEHWVTLGHRLNAQGYAVVLPHGSPAEAEQAQAIAQELTHAQVLPRLAVDALIDTFSQCAGVVGVDSGLSHIAVALDLPHVQLYNFDTAWRTGPQGQRRQVCLYRPGGPTLDEVWGAWVAVSRDVG